MAPIIKSSVSGFDATTYPSPSSSPVATRRMAKAALRTAPAPAAVDTDVAASRRKRVLTEAAEWSDDEGDQEDDGLDTDHRQYHAFRHKDAVLGFLPQLVRRSMFYRVMEDFL
jgi:hypothetical protein